MKSLVGRTIARKYVVRDVLGRGANAVVYDALDLKMTRPVAIKVPTFGGLDAEQILRRFRREVRASASIAHPNVCGTHDAGQLDDGTPFLVTERLEGESLAARLQREGQLSLERAIVIFSQVLSALAAAHARRIIHRDVKPANIFLAHVDGYDELVKVLDFGASKRIRSGTDTDRASDSGGDLTAVGCVFGTPHYMAPERIRHQTTSPQIDLFACGASLFETLTGERLYRSHDPDEIFREILTLPARTVRSVIPSLPIEVDDVVRGALRRDPKDRYASAAAFQRALKALAPLARTRDSARLVSTQENAQAKRLIDLKAQFHELAGRHRAMRESMEAERNVGRRSTREPNLPSVVEEDPEGTRTTERRNISSSIAPGPPKSREKKHSKKRSD